jgi:hypothetical protein
VGLLGTRRPGGCRCVGAIFEHLHYDRAHAEGLAGAVGHERYVCGCSCHDEGGLMRLLFSRLVMDSW